MKNQDFIGRSVAIFLLLLMAIFLASCGHVYGVVSTKDYANKGGVATYRTGHRTDESRAKAIEEAEKFCGGPVNLLSESQHGESEGGTAYVATPRLLLPIRRGPRPSPFFDIQFSCKDKTTAKGSL